MRLTCEPTKPIPIPPWGIRYGGGMTPSTTRVLAALAASAAVVFLSACSSSASDGHADHPQSSQSARSTEHPAAFNDADVSFATNMIPHHEQAVEMSTLVPDRSQNPAVVKLAADIAAAQGPEIQTMKVFLVQWTGGEAPAGQGGGHDMAGMQMPGMVDEATMTKLGSLKGSEFDTLWLQSMIGHH